MVRTGYLGKFSLFYTRFSAHPSIQFRLSGRFPLSKVAQQPPEDLLGKKRERETPFLEGEVGQPYGGWSKNTRGSYNGKRHGVHRGFINANNCCAMALFSKLDTQ